MEEKYIARKIKWAHLRQSQKLGQWRIAYAQKFLSFRSYNVVVRFLWSDFGKVTKDLTVKFWSLGLSACV